MCVTQSYESYEGQFLPTWESPTYTHTHSFIAPLTAFTGCPPVPIQNTAESLMTNQFCTNITVSV